MKIRLNKYGKVKYGELADTWLNVYGYNPDEYGFIVWNDICDVWIIVKLSECEGMKNV